MCAVTTVDQIRLEKILGQKVSTMATPRYRDAAILEELCSHCGGEVACVYDDIGATDYHDNFVHVCLNHDCEFFLHHEERVMKDGGRPEDPTRKCYWCSRPLQMTV